MQDRADGPSRWCIDPNEFHQSDYGVANQAPLHLTDHVTSSMYPDSSGVGEWSGGLDLSVEQYGIEHDDIQSVQSAELVLREMGANLRARLARKALSPQTAETINQILDKYNYTHEFIRNMSTSERNKLSMWIYETLNHRVPLLDILRFYQQVLLLPDNQVAAVFNHRASKNWSLARAARNAKGKGGKTASSYIYFNNPLSRDQKAEIETDLSIRLEIQPGLIGALETMEEVEDYTRPYIYDPFREGKIDPDRVRLLNRYLRQIVGLNPKQIEDMDAIRAEALHMTVLELTETSRSRARKTFLGGGKSSPSTNISDSPSSCLDEGVHVKGPYFTLQPHRKRRSYEEQVSPSSQFHGVPQLVDESVTQASLHDCNPYGQCHGPMLHPYKANRGSGGQPPTFFGT